MGKFKFNKSLHEIRMSEGREMEEKEIPFQFPLVTMIGLRTKYKSII